MRRRLRSLVSRSSAPVVTVLDFRGMIVGDDVPEFRRRTTITYNRVTEWLDLAFNKEVEPKAVMLNIDCPGGQPGATEMIYSAIRRASEDSKIPVIACAQNVAASGGYWLLCAADEAYALNTSLVGSIGVIMSSFGFQGVLSRLGVERRVLTAGHLKGVADPFREMSEAERAVLNDVAGDMHTVFQNLVVERRGDRLKASHDELFSGRVWTGRRAAELGLVDGVADMHSLARSKFGKEVQLLHVNPPGKVGWFSPGRWVQSQVQAVQEQQAAQQAAQLAVQQLLLQHQQAGGAPLDYAGGMGGPSLLWQPGFDTQQM